MLNAAGLLGSGPTPHVCAPWELGQAGPSASQCSFPTRKAGCGRCEPGSHLLPRPTHAAPSVFCLSPTILFFLVLLQLAIILLICFAFVGS